MHGNAYAAPSGANLFYFVDEGLNVINATRWPAVSSLAAMRSVFGYESFPVDTGGWVGKRKLRFLGLFLNWKLSAI